MIFDARSAIAASGNRLKGKGPENTAGRYTQCRLIHMDIDNIHAMRDSASALQSACCSRDDERWLSTLEATRWLAHVQSVLKAACTIARYVIDRGISAVIHCSDGWDRTTQLASLAQILCDPYFRSIDGFRVLIEKDWLAFGHRFHERHAFGESSTYRSPVFLQFLDCVWQLMQQFPTAFEFTGSLLIAMLDGVNTQWYGRRGWPCARGVAPMVDGAGCRIVAQQVRYVSV